MLAVRRPVHILAVALEWILLGLTLWRAFRVQTGQPSTSPAAAPLAVDLEAGRGRRGELSVDGWTVPDLIGNDDVGMLSPGRRADVVVASNQLELLQVYRSGALQQPAPKERS